MQEFWHPRYLRFLLSAASLTILKRRKRIWIIRTLPEFAKKDYEQSTKNKEKKKRRFYLELPMHCLPGSNLNIHALQKQKLVGVLSRLLWLPRFIYIRSMVLKKMMSITKEMIIPLQHNNYSYNANFVSFTLVVHVGVSSLKKKFTKVGTTSWHILVRLWVPFGRSGTC